MLNLWKNEQEVKATGRNRGNGGVAKTSLTAKSRQQQMNIKLFSDWFTSDVHVFCTGTCFGKWFLSSQQKDSISKYLSAGYVRKPGSVSSWHIEVQASILFSLNKQPLRCFLWYVKLPISFDPWSFAEDKYETPWRLCQAFSKHPEKKKGGHKRKQLLLAIPPEVRGLGSLSSSPLSRLSGETTF